MHLCAQWLKCSDKWFKWTKSTLKCNNFFADFILFYSVTTIPSFDSSEASNTCRASLSSTSSLSYFEL